MFKKLSSIFVLLGVLNYSDVLAEELPPQKITPELVETQLEQAESEFKEAKKMFDPWYAGPLLTGSAHILSPGLISIQPYLYYFDNYARFDKHGHSHNIPDLTQFNPVFIFQVGIVKRLDGLVIVQGFYNHQSGQHATNFGDTTLKFDIGILEEKPYRPAIAFGIKEVFPTGKYENLSSHKNGVDATGAGSYQTGVNLNISKIVWWISTHPMDFRLSLNYVFPVSVSVSGFNNYGGGFGTHGKIHPGQNFAINFGYEFSFTQKWVIALDTAYTYSFKSTFTGTPGVDVLRAPAINGSPFNDQLSLAPAIEYNPNPNLGVIAGVWFSVWGRNSLNFVSGVFSVTYTF